DVLSCFQSTMIFGALGLGRKASGPFKVPSSPPSAMCPRTRVKCLHEERDQCTKNRHCPENMKCCRFGCRKECLDLNKDVCSMPKESGPCMAFMPRWWYDKKTERCYRFIYGGCLGNNNNFQSEICLWVCKPPGEFSYRNRKSNGGDRMMECEGKECW
uniref:BPTI/Kunitz inhibitor domain-containing protein n=1 Tax=Equus asinus asinus TaxID=83772 RepID=A0A8C4PW08_EQUAS